MAADTSRPAVALPGLLADLRLTCLALVVGVAPWNPTWALRQGAFIAGLILLASVPTLRGRLPAADVLAGLYGLLAWCSMAWSSDPESTALGWRNSVACVVLFWAVRACVRRRRDLVVLCGAYLIGCGISLAALWSQNGLTFDSLRLQYDSNAARLGIEGLNFNALAYALTLGAISLSILVATRTGQIGMARRVMIIVACFALFVGVQANGTRGALVAMFAGAVWLLVCRAANARRMFVWVVAVATASALGIFTGWADGPLREIADPSARETGFLNGRLLIWPMARETFGDHWWLGSGLDAILGEWRIRIAAHNVLLDVAAGLGLAGLALLLAFLIATFHASGWRRSRANATVAGLTVAIGTPIALTGYVIELPALWLTLAFISRLSASRQHAVDLDGLAVHVARKPPVAPDRGL